MIYTWAETSTLLECDKKLRSRGKEGEDMGASGREDGIGRQLRGEMGHEMNINVPAFMSSRGEQDERSNMSVCARKPIVCYDCDLYKYEYVLCFESVV